MVPDDFELCQIAHDLVRPEGDEAFDPHVRLPKRVHATQVQIQIAILLPISCGYDSRVVPSESEVALQN